MHGLEHAVAQFQSEAAALRLERDRLLQASLYNTDGGYTTTASSSASSSAASSDGTASPPGSSSSTPASLDHGGGGGGMEGGYASADDAASASASAAVSPRFFAHTRGGGGSSSPAHGPSSSSGGGGSNGAFPLFGALFLFTFLAAPSTLLLGLRGGRGRTTGDGGLLGGLQLPQRPASSPTAGPLVAVSAIRDLALPFVGGKGEGVGVGEKGEKGEEGRGGQYWPPVLYGPHLPTAPGQQVRL